MHWHTHIYIYIYIYILYNISSQKSFLWNNENGHKRTIVLESFVIVGSLDCDHTQLFIPNAILLNNKIDLPIFSVKVEQVKDELQKPILNVKVKKIEQGNGYVKVW